MPSAIFTEVENFVSEFPRTFVLCPVNQDSKLCFTRLLDTNDVSSLGEIWNGAINRNTKPSMMQILSGPCPLRKHTFLDDEISRDGEPPLPSVLGAFLQLFFRNVCSVAFSYDGLLPVRRRRAFLLPFLLHA